MKYILLLAVLLIARINSYSQGSGTFIIANPSQNDYCTSSPNITLTPSPFDPTHTYHWMYEYDWNFENTGGQYPDMIEFGAGNTIDVYPGEFGACTSIAIEEYDASNNYIGLSFPFFLGSTWGQVPVYYNECDNMYVPNSYTPYWASGRSAMWYKNGTATGITDPYISDPDAGDYQYVLTLGCGSTVSSSVKTINPPAKPVISASGPATVCQGDTVTLSISGGFSYPYWYRDGTYLNVSGSTYKATVSGNYTVQAQVWTGQSNCTKTSEPFSVTVQSGAFITSADTAKCGGDSIKLNCTAASSYSWKRDGSVIPAATAQSFWAKVSGNYEVITTGLICNSSKVKHIGIYNYPTITTTPQSPITLCNGKGLTLNATGTNINAYQWLKGSVVIVGGTISSLYITKSGSYKCRVSNLIGCSTSSAAISVSGSVTTTLPSKTLVIQPTSAAGIDTWITSAFGNQNVNYPTQSYMEVSNWYKYFRTADRSLIKFDLSAIPPNTEILSATLKLYIDSVASWTNAAQTLFIKRNVQSFSTVGLGWYNQPATTDYQGITIPQTSIASHKYFSANLLDIVNYWVNTGDNNGLKILSNEATTNNYLGWLRIATSDNATTSQRPKLTVKYAYAKIDSSGPLTFCNGDSVMLSTTSGSYVYQWYKNNAAISGASTYTYTAKTTGDYFVTITNAAGCSVASDKIHVTVNSLPSASNTPQGPTTFCNGDSVKLQANTGTGLTYQWQKNGVNISGATASFYYAKTAGSYRVKITNGSGCSKLSAAINVSVPCRDGEIISFKGLEMYPNPFSENFIVKTNDEKPIDEIKVFDVDGKLMEDFHLLNSGSIIGDEWKKGVFIIEIICGSQNEFRRVIKL